MSATGSRRRPDPLRIVSRGCAWGLLVLVAVTLIRWFWGPTFGQDDLGLADGAYWVDQAANYFDPVVLLVVLLILVGVALNHAITDEPLASVELAATMTAFLWAFVGVIFNLGAAWVVSTGRSGGGETAARANFYNENQGYYITVFCLGLLVALLVQRIALVLVTKPHEQADDPVARDWERAETVAMPPYDRPVQPDS